jgi:Xaa-Pro aminopeptidase
MIDYTARIEKTRGLMRACNVDTLLISNIEEGRGVNIQYLSGFSGSAGVLILTQERQILITDFRYELQVKQESPAWDISVLGGYKLGDLAGFIKECASSRLGFVGEEISWERINKLHRELPEVEFVPLSNIVREIRAVKDIAEIEMIKTAVRMIEGVLREL